jgi:hypothetical protein
VCAAAQGDGFNWSIHRPHTVIGKAVGNAMNMGTTLAVYAPFCRETGRPFRFPGSAAQWNGLTAMTNARQLARHLLWAAMTPAAQSRPSMSSTAMSSAGAGAALPTGQVARSLRSSSTRQGTQGKHLSSGWRKIDSIEHVTTERVPVSVLSDGQLEEVFMGFESNKDLKRKIS